MIGKLVLGVLTSAAVLTGVGVVVTTMSGDDAVVTHIVDGDTFDATVAGRPVTVRLLNVDTPETKDPDADVECLGPEAAARLAEMIPVGSTVSLSYDEERSDRWGRTLAGVHDEDGLLVNAELAREGLGTAVLVGGNDRFYNDVVEAQSEARSAARGLYSTEVPCTVPARVLSATSAVAAAQQDTPAPFDPVALDRAAERAAGLARRIDDVRSTFTGPRRGLVWAALSMDDDRRLTEALTTAGDRAHDQHSAWTAVAASVRDQIKAAAEQAERDRVAQEQAAREASARDAADREAADREAAARRAEQRSRATAAPQAASAPTGGGCDPNYTPCVPLSEADLDCGDLSGGPFTVIGTDRHRLDLGGVEGVGCESQG